MTDQTNANISANTPTRGIWKSGKGRGKARPKGRALDEAALSEIEDLLAGRPRNRDLLIEFLHVLQDEYGHLSARHLRALSEWLNVSMAEIWEVATFYAHFDVVKEGEAPPPPLTIRVCDSLSCQLTGAEELLRQLQEVAGENDRVRVLRAPCMGRCDSAPVIEYAEHQKAHHHVGHASAEKVHSLINPGSSEAAAIASADTASQRSSKQDLAAGYETLKALHAGEKSPDDIQQVLLDAGLRGAGGAGFPAGRKWSFVRAEPAPRFLAVNADEGEPGTFKDRHYLETAPRQVLEGMLIAAWAIEAQKCFIYLRDEYPQIRKTLQACIGELEDSGLVATGYIDLRRGAGAYICGEESAMIESIEGKRGLPRHRPPYVAQKGIFDRPTLVHNVETLYWVSEICRKGPQIFSAVEKNGRKGLRSYSVSGRIKTPGVKLLAAGSTIMDVIEACGGMCDGHEFFAYQPGGPSSGLLPARLNDIPLDFDMLEPHGTFIGSAAIVVLSDKDKARGAALNMLQFFARESCGQCTPCRLGCEKAVRLMQKEKWDKPLLEDLCDVMQDASICGLGQAAPNAIRSTLKYFPDEV